MKKMKKAADAKTTTGDAALIEECRRRSVELLRENLVSEGILAARRTERARSRGYCAIFGRDASICALGMAVSGDPVLERGAVAGLASLAAHQAPNGQIPNIVTPRHATADFWYVGCIDATLWWLIAIAALDRLQGTTTLRRRFRRQVERAIHWLRCQEHPHFQLLQQNEASDWADIMPRSGFVLYSNALWHLVKIQYGIDGAASTRTHARQLFMPFSGAPARDKRVRLMALRARTHARHKDLLLSYVNLGTFGDEGDTFANALALLCGLIEGPTARKVLAALRRENTSGPFPLRVVRYPIRNRSREWRSYMKRHRQNFAWQYHNGGIWPFAGGLYVTALADSGERRMAKLLLAQLARANALGTWGFVEWMHGRTGAPLGMHGQSWNAATFLIAHHALREAGSLLREPGKQHEGRQNNDDRTGRTPVSRRNARPSVPASRLPHRA